MRSLRALTLVLVALVLIPAAVLAYLGVRGAEGHADRMRQRVREELAAAAPAVRASAEALVEADAQRALVVVDELARIAARRLPFGSPGRTLFDLRVLASRLPLPTPGEAGAAKTRTRSRAEQALDYAWMQSWIDVRILDAAGGQVWPAVHGPVPEDHAGAEVDRLWRDLRASAEEAVFGRHDLAAGLAVWTQAAAQVKDPAWRLRVEVEEALLTTALSGSADGAEAAVVRLREVWPDESLDAIGRPWALLLLRAAPAGGTARRRLVELETRLDEIPLTSEERARLYEITRPLWARSPQPGAGWDVRSAPLPAGMRLEVRRHWPDPTQGPIAEALHTWLGDLRLVLPSLVVEHAGPQGPFHLLEPSSGMSQVLSVPLIGGTRTTLRLSQRDAELIEAQAAGQRRWTIAGALGLVGVIGLGLVVIRMALAREREARRLKDDFLANVSHELRTPLTAVCLHADLLAEPTLPDAHRRAHAEVVRAEGARLAAMVDDLLDFAALERGSRRLEVEPVDLGAAVRRAAEPFRVLAEREGVDLRVDESAGEATALADPHALARILANLVGNAWKHGRPSRDGAPGRLRIAAAGAGVTVQDDGPGIPAADRVHLFERFRRGAAAARTRGVGLGLALSRDLARAMGGDLVVVEDPEATVFRLTLPHVPPLPPLPPAPPESSA